MTDLRDRAREALSKLMDRLDALRATGAMADTTEWDDDAAQFVADHGQAIRAALSTPPEGCVLVPREPTCAMIDAARHDWHHNHGPQSQTLYGEFIVGIWRAMLAAHEAAGEERG